MLKLICRIALLVGSATVSAQVYQSVDDQENTVFSDQPSTGSQPVEFLEPTAVDGELIGEKRKKNHRIRLPTRPTPRGNSGGGR